MILPVVFPSLSLVKRELLRSLRQIRTFFILSLFILAIIAITGLAWPYEQIVQAGVAGMQSQRLFDAFALVLVAVAVMLLPGYAAANLAAERDLDTYDQLRLTLIRTTGIVFANYVNSIAFYLLLCIAGLPVFCTVFFGVGVGLGEVFTAITLIAIFAAASIIIGTGCGAFFRKTLPAIAGSYIAVGALWLTPSLLESFRIIRFTRPYSGAYSGDSGRLWAYAYEIHMFVYICLVLLFFLIYTIRRLHRPPKPAKVLGEKPIDNAAELAARRKQFPFYLIDPLRRKEMIPDNRNPLFLRELHTGITTRGTLAIRYFYLSALIFTIVTIYFTWPNGYNFMRGPRDLGVTAVVLSALACLATIALTVNMFTKEREQENIDMLRMTLLTPRQIVWGKWASGLLILAPIMAGIVVAATPGLIILGLSSRNMLIVVGGDITCFICICVALSASLYVSLWTKRTSVAFVLGCLLLLALMMGPFIFCVVAHETMPYMGAWPPPWMVWISPPFSYFNCFVESYNKDTYIWYVSLCVYAGICACLHALTVSRLNAQFRE